MGCGGQLVIKQRRSNEVSLKIYFEDLIEAAQKEVLEFYEIDRPEQANLDEFPLFELEQPETED